MKHDIAAEPTWSTASFGAPADTTPGELSTLGEHLKLCRGNSGRSFALLCGADKVHGFVASRMVTTLVLLVAVACAGLVIW